MEKITITFDKVGNTLDVGLKNQGHALMKNRVIIKKDESGEIIGFEKINYLKREEPDKVQSIPLGVAVV